MSPSKAASETEPVPSRPRRRAAPSGPGLGVARRPATSAAGSAAHPRPWPSEHLQSPRAHRVLRSPRSPPASETQSQSQTKVGSWRGMRSHRTARTAAEESAPALAATAGPVEGGAELRKFPAWAELRLRWQSGDFHFHIPPSFLPSFLPSLLSVAFLPQVSNPLLFLPFFFFYFLWAPVLKLFSFLLFFLSSAISLCILVYF